MFYNNKVMPVRLSEILSDLLTGDISFLSTNNYPLLTHEALELLDSIYMEYPVGMVVLWQTSLSPSQEAATKHPRRFIFDGYRRLDMLFNILAPGLDIPVRIPEPMELEFVFDLKEYKFNNVEFPESTEIPLSIILNRLSVNKWIRKANPELTEKQIRVVESLGDKMREYAVPVYTWTSDSVEQATNLFRSINRRHNYSYREIKGMFDPFK